LKTHSGEKSNKCNQCDYASSEAGDLRRHLKTHSGEKLNKCNQCDYASSREGNLKTHLKTHSGEKLNKCNQCDYASSRADVLRTHLKAHNKEKSKICNQCDLHPLMQVLWGHIWKHTVRGCRRLEEAFENRWRKVTNATSVTLHHINQAI